MRTDLGRSLRRLRPESRLGTLCRRDDADLPFAADAPLVGGPLMLDTTVYIDVIEGSSPPEVDALLEQRLVNHSAVAVGELCHNFGRLDPTHPGTSTVVEELKGVVEDIPAYRLEAPSSGTLLEAGILAGLLFRLGGLPKGAEVSAFNDAAIFLHALDKGYAVLTRNIRDFDVLSQIVPSGRVLLYRKMES